MCAKLCRRPRLGREFELRLLAQMLREDLELPQKVKRAEKANIWTPLTEIEYLFRHALLRDAAYSMQLQSRQRELHNLALSAMLTLYADDLELHYGELAFHSEHAGTKIRRKHILHWQAEPPLPRTKIPLRWIILYAHRVSFLKTINDHNLTCYLIVPLFMVVWEIAPPSLWIWIRWNPSLNSLAAFMPKLELPPARGFFLHNQ